MALSRTSTNMTDSLLSFPGSIFPLMDSFSPMPFLANRGKSAHLSVKEDLSAVLTVEVPGYNANSVKVSVQRGVLVIKLHGEDENIDYEYKRTLPKTVDQSSVTASVEDGVLRVNLPRYEEESFEVNVTSGSGDSTFQNVKVATDSESDNANQGETDPSEKEE